MDSYLPDHESRAGEGWIPREKNWGYDYEVECAVAADKNKENKTHWMSIIGAIYETQDPANCPLAEAF